MRVPHRGGILACQCRRKRGSTHTAAPVSPMSRPATAANAIGMSSGADTGTSARGATVGDGVGGRVAAGTAMAEGVTAGVGFGVTARVVGFTVGRGC
jgi:hypothetical protein